MDWKGKSETNRLRAYSAKNRVRARTSKAGGVGVRSLRAQDVSSTITAPVKIAKASEDGRLNATLAATAKTLASYSSTMKDLSSRLNEPFVTVNTVTGDTGIKKAQDEYEQLIRNKTPKSRR